MENRQQEREVPRNCVLVAARRNNGAQLYIMLCYKMRIFRRRILILSRVLRK